MKNEQWRARLTVKGLPEWDKKELTFFRKWIGVVAEEMQKANPKDYSARYRATLYGLETNYEAAKLGSKGGTARARKLPPARRKEIATKASHSRKKTPLQSKKNV